MDEIKTILDATAVDDYYVKKYNHVKSGRGKLDAYAGLKYLLATNIGNMACAQNQVLIYPSGDGNIAIYAQGETGNIRAEIFTAGGTEVYGTTLSTSAGSTTLDINGRLTAGIYIVKVQGKKARGSNTLVIK